MAGFAEAGVQPFLSAERLPFAQSFEAAIFAVAGLVMSCRALVVCEAISTTPAISVAPTSILKSLTIRISSSIAERNEGDELYSFTSIVLPRGTFSSKPPPYTESLSGTEDLNCNN